MNKGLSGIKIVYMTRRRPGGGKKRRDKFEPVSKYVRPAERGLKHRTFKQRTALPAVLILLVTAAVIIAHWPALSAQALSFDDNQYLTENYLVQNPGWGSAKRFLLEILEPSTVQGYYQPLAMISLMADCAAGGTADNLMPFHRTSLLLHAANTGLVIILIYMLFGQPVIAAMLGLLFGLHPMTVETIAWVGERKTLLAAFFCLCCLISYVRYARSGSWKWYVTVAVLYVLALMSKPTSTPLPVLLLLLDYWPLNRLSRRSVLEKVPLLVIGVISSVITVVSQGRTASVTMPESKSLSESILILFHNIVFYPYKMLFPLNLSSHYPVPNPVSIAEPMVFLGVVGSCILAVVLLLSLRRSRCLLAGWLFFFVAIFPTMGVIGFTNVIASDKFAYLPCVGLLLPVGYFLSRVWAVSSLSVSVNKRAVICMTVCVLAVSEAFATRGYLHHWQNSETLLRRMLTLSPQADSLHNGLGLLLFNEGKTDEAVKCYRQALKLNSNNAETHNNLGIALAANGKADEAVAHYEKARQLRPNYPATHNNLGNALTQLGRLEEAVIEYRKALEIKPLHPTAHYNLGIAFEKQGKLKEAAEEYTAAIKINPGYAQAYNNLGNVRAAQGKTNEAIAAYRNAVMVDADFASAHYNLAITLTEQKRIAEAITEYQQALRIQGDYFDAHNNLAVLLSQNGRYEEAVKHFSEAVKIQPGDIDTYNNLGVTYMAMGKVGPAIAWFQRTLQIDPGNSNAHFNLAVNFERTGRLEQAVEHYRQTLRTNAQHQPARQGLERILTKMQQR